MDGARMGPMPARNTRRLAQKRARPFDWPRTSADQRADKQAALRIWQDAGGRTLGTYGCEIHRATHNRLLHPVERHTQPSATHGDMVAVSPQPERAKPWRPGPQKGAVVA